VKFGMAMRFSGAAGTNAVQHEEWILLVDFIFRVGSPLYRLGMFQLTHQRTCSGLRLRLRLEQRRLRSEDGNGL
jgi:hypothetical protein